MKTLIKRTALAIAICATFTACSIWQDEETAIQPLPEVETPIHIEPWEQPPETDTESVGE